MTTTNTITNAVPTLEDFLAAPIEQVAEVAPATMIYGPGGTRRSAAFSGIEPWSAAYIQWARQETIRCFDILFRHGVQHVFATALVPSNFSATHGYREKLVKHTAWGLAGDGAIADYVQHDWRVRILGTEGIPVLEDAAQKLVESTSAASHKTLWWSVVPERDTPWNALLRAAVQHQARTRAEAIVAFYGESIPLATLYLAFGKLMVSYEVLPPLLVDRLHCYWSQRAGYSLTDRQFRMVLYDYAYLRSTTQDDMIQRAKDAAADQSVWQRGPIIGLGEKLGPFWYPMLEQPADWLDGS